MRYLSSPQLLDRSLEMQISRIKESWNDRQACFDTCQRDDVRMVGEIPLGCSYNVYLYAE